MKLNNGYTTKKCWYMMKMKMIYDNTQQTNVDKWGGEIPHRALFALSLSTEEEFYFSASLQYSHLILWASWTSWTSLYLCKISPVIITLHYRARQNFCFFASLQYFYHEHLEHGFVYFTCPKKHYIASLRYCHFI